MAPKTYPNEIKPENDIWLKNVKRVKTRGVPQRINQGMPPYVIVHTTELLGNQVEGNVFRLPNEQEVEKWYANAPWPYQFLYAHESLTKLHYKATKTSQTPISLAEGEEPPEKGYTQLYQGRPLNVMGWGTKGTKWTGGHAVNFGSELAVQIAILGVAASVNKHTDEFYADFAEVLADIFEAISEQSHLNILAAPFQTKVGVSGGWGNGIAKAISRYGTGNKTGKYRMSKKEFATLTVRKKRSWAAPVGTKFNLFGHVHTLALNTHWDPGAIDWVRLSKKVNAILIERYHPKPVAKPKKAAKKTVNELHSEGTEQILSGVAGLIRGALSQISEAETTLKEAIGKLTK